MKKKMLYCFLVFCFVLQAQLIFAAAAGTVTMYSADGRELLVPENEVEAQKTVGWFTAPPVWMYAADGRQILVSGDETEAYQAVGWYLEPMRIVYAPFDRTLLIPAWQVQDYVNVGWFTTYDEALYNEVVPQIQYTLSVTDYNGAIDLCDSALGRFYSSENVFYEDIVSKKYAAMDTWRAVIHQPVAVLSSNVSEYYSIQRAHITLRNISYKPIVALELEFHCYNAFGEPVQYYGIGSSLYEGYIQSMQLDPLETEVWYWDLYGFGEAASINNIKVVRVAFADGTIWG